ncbi:MAG: hypothetical protein RI883_638 [Bacteroidota bacterium]|jgi:hypothetical protein
MKKLIFIVLAIGCFMMNSCDKVENPFPPVVNNELDTTIYNGSWSDYVANEWPDFSVLPNDDPNRNALIEDMTGHNCSNCPAAAAIAHGIHLANPTRIFIASIHAAATSTGTSTFQDVNNGLGITVDFTNSQSKEMGSFFGTTLINSGFFANPSGTISRTNVAGEYFVAQGSWQTKVNAVLAKPLQIAIKAKVNYFETPKHGFFLHTEVEKLDAAITNELGMIVYLIEDTLVAPQNISGTITPTYVHRDIFRGCIDGQTWGRTLTADMMTGTKYYLNYSYILPDQLVPTGNTSTHNADNMHLLIYVYDKVSLEIYQIVEKNIIP